MGLNPALDERRPSGDMLYDARALARCSIGAAAQMAGISPRHWRRLEQAPRVRRVYAMLMTMIGGYPWDPVWSGWRFWKGRLWSPEGVEFRPEDLNALPYLRSGLTEARRTIEELRAELKATVARIPDATGPQRNRARPECGMRCRRRAQTSAAGDPEPGDTR